MVDLAVACLGA